ncbi:methyltransferase [Streptomyces sp. NBC_01373]|nr:methyltransferase [Streptomyces sp. NBC_01373]
MRGEYVDLVARAPLPTFRTAFDLGTGTGVLAAVLARRGVGRLVATDISPRALVCARDNLGRLGLAVDPTAHGRQQVASVVEVALPQQGGAFAGQPVGGVGTRAVVGDDGVLGPAIRGHDAVLLAIERAGARRALRRGDERAESYGSSRTGEKAGRLGRLPLPRRSARGTVSEHRTEDTECHEQPFPSG